MVKKVRRSEVTCMKACMRVFTPQSTRTAEWGGTGKDGVKGLYYIAPIE
jgi:hypothetical protein